jgi:stage V sporulation protein R
MQINNKTIDTESEWTFEKLEKYDSLISSAATRFGLTTYPNQIEIISSEQMMDAYSSVGMPIGYNHWSFGKKFIQTQQNYNRGSMGLAYEIVINSSPCISYLMEENSMTMQALVIAHACYGHNSFFKNNYLFTTWTDAEAIVDYLVFAKKFISDCEEKYGITNVENILDSCHALMNLGVDRYKRPSKISMREEQTRQTQREEYLQSQVNDLWRTVPIASSLNDDRTTAIFPEQPQENLLYFIEKHAPLLLPWQREIIRIVRKVAQYFYPQKQTQVMNEGWACFWHYTLINTLYDDGQLSDTFMLEFLHHHTNVIYQPPYNSPHYSGINPYTLGFSMFQDIRRICEKPTEEDRLWFKDIAGSDWLETLHFACKNFKDESFISQYLSPHLIRKLKLFNTIDNDKKNYIEIDAIHNEQGYQRIREALSEQYNLSNIEPNIQVYNVDMTGDRALTLRYYPHNSISLSDNIDEMMRHVHRLWGFDVVLEQGDGENATKELTRCSKSTL